MMVAHVVPSFHEWQQVRNVENGEAMKALQCHALGDDLSGVSVADVLEPDPLAGEVKVRVAACALNFPDLLMTKGGYQFAPALPFTLGTEACGDVVAVGAGCDAELVGARVIVGAREGCAAEYVCVSQTQVRRAPVGLSETQAAALTVTGLTAWVGLKVRGRLQAGERVLVLGAGSGVGLAAIDVALAAGATVIAAASSEAKLAPARARGVATVVTPRSGLSASDLKAALGGPVDVVYDPIGAAMAEPAIRALAWKGRYLIIGFAGGSIPRVPLNLALLKGADIIGVRAGEYGRRDPAAHARHLAAIDALAAAGKLRSHIGLACPLADGLTALHRMNDGTLTGKAVLSC
jgi:NADPH:quinone reductase